MVKRDSFSVMSALIYILSLRFMRLKIIFESLELMLCCVKVKLLNLVAVTIFVNDISNL